MFVYKICCLYIFMFWTLRRFRFLYKSCECVSCSVSGTVSLEIYFAALEFASYMYYMHFHTLQSHKEPLSMCMWNIFIVFVIFSSLYLTILYEFVNLFNCFIRSSICSLKLKDSSRISPKYLAWCTHFIVMLPSWRVFSYSGTVLSLAGQANIA